MNQEQYAILCARRQSFDNLVWQTPSLATAAQAFLIAAAFDSGSTPINSLILASFSGVVGLASIQLIAKHRHNEVEDSEILKKYELSRPGELTVLHGKRQPNNGLLTRFSSFKIWSLVLWGFFALAVFGVTEAVCRMIE